MVVAGHPFQALLLGLETEQQAIVCVGGACALGDGAQLHQFHIDKSWLLLYGWLENGCEILEQVLFFGRVDIEVHVQLNAGAGCTGGYRHGEGRRGYCGNGISTVHLKILHQFADSE